MSESIIIAIGKSKSRIHLKKKDLLRNTRHRSLLNILNRDISNLCTSVIQETVTSLFHELKLFFFSLAAFLPAFLAACRCGADNLTLPGMFLERSTSLTAFIKSFSNGDVVRSCRKRFKAVFAAFPFLLVP